MPCEECAIRTQHVAASEQLLAEKRFKYAVLHPFTKERILGIYEHAVKTARANLERHMAEHEREE